MSGEIIERDHIPQNLIDEIEELKRLVRELQEKVAQLEQS